MFCALALPQKMRATFYKDEDMLAKYPLKVPPAESGRYQRAPAAAECKLCLDKPAQVRAPRRAMQRRARRRCRRPTGALTASAPAGLRLSPGRQRAGALTAAAPAPRSPSHALKRAARTLC